MKVHRRECGRRVRIPASPNPMIFREPGGAIPRSARPKSVLSKPKRARRPTPAWIRAVGRNLEPILWFGVLGALALSLWFSPRTQLHTLQVVGAPASVHSQISETIARLPALAPRLLEKHLQRYPWVAHAQWEGVRSGVWRITLVPRRGVVEVRAPQSPKRYIDSAGFVFSAPNDLPQAPTGTIRVLETQRMPSEGSIRSGEIARAFEIVRALAGDPRLQRVQLNLHPDGAQVLHLQRATSGAESLQVRLGDALQWREQVGLVKKLLDAPAEELRKWAYVDLKSPKAPAIRLRNPLQGGER